MNKQRHSEKIQMKKTIKAHEEKKTKGKKEAPADTGAVPAYLLDREQQTQAKVISNMVKQKRKEKAGKWEVPIPTVRAPSEAEVFKVLKSGKTRRKGWKRMVTKVTFVGDNFTRKPPKFERFIRPMGLRMKKAHVTHPELRATFCLPIIGVKKNPSSPMYTNLGVITKGTVIKVNHDYVFNSAKLLKAAGCPDFHLLTSKGSNPKSWFLYPETKGRVEDSVRGLGFERYNIYRPGFLKCDRAESRQLEAAIRWLANKVDSGHSWSVPTSMVAAAMVNNSLVPSTMEIMEHHNIVEAAANK